MKHPFELSASQLTALKRETSQVDHTNSLSAPTDDPSLPVATTVGAENGTDEPRATTLAEGEEGGGTTEALGEEGGITPVVIQPEQPTTFAIGEEGGEALLPVITGAIGESGDIIAIPAPGNLNNTPTTTLATGEEGGTTTEAFDNSENGDTAIPTSLAIGEEGGISEPIPTSLAIGEEGGIIPVGLPPGVPITSPGEFTTQAVGEEGGIATPIDRGTITEPGVEDGENFSEDIYQQSYPDIDNSINRGEFSSGLEHYIQFGQFEIERIGFFTGSDRNDIVTAFGNNTRIVGVSPLGYDVVNDEILPNSFGVGEIDILVANNNVEGVDEFILGVAPDSPFYVGFNNFDFAVIKNFDVSLDRIKLPGVITDYGFEIVNNSVNISTASGDLIAIIEDVASVVENVDFIFSN